MTDIIAQLVIPSLLIHCLDDVPEPPAQKTALDQMFGGFLTPRALLKTTRERAKEEILKYRERASLDLDLVVMCYSGGDTKEIFHCLQLWQSTFCPFLQQKCSVGASI